MAFLRLVVERCPLLYRGGEHGRVDRRREGLHLFDHVQQVPTIPVSHRDQRLARIVIKRQPAAEQLLRPGGELAEGRVVEALQDEHLAAGQQRTVEFETRVLGGGPDEHDGAILHMGEK